jgi:pimeloyl-ACP methyl ester carboxylesterase
MVDGTRIYYEECGDGMPLFCVHTAGACSIEYYQFRPIMADQGFWAIAVDLPGHGKSYPVSWEPFRVMHDYAEFVWKIIEAVCVRSPLSWPGAQSAATW